MLSKEVKEVGEFVGRPQIGQFYFFSYDPKLKEILPIYDRFPFSLMLHPYNDGFLGLNLHYVPRAVRRKIMDDLIAIQGMKKITDRSRIHATYGYLTRLSRFSDIQKCIKRYLFNHARSQFLQVKPSKWKVCADMHVASFVKGKPY